MKDRVRDIIIIALIIAVLILFIAVALGFHLITLNMKLDMCKIDCNNLNLQYWKFDSSLFGKDSCICLDKNTPKEIWES